MAAAIQQASVRGETFEKSALWDEFAGRCLSCGACSLCCPTCYCFDIREYGALDGETTMRLREWDNCLFKDHGEVAGGFNFRKSRQERFHYRYQHKYLGFGPTRGIVSCVGCGRCRVVCPVGIDLLELFKESEDEKRP
jgi:formate hydrogenlyase subunit 6/NADH:ubiquinone oxidoreductase subunit I